MSLIDLPQSKWGGETGRQPILKGDFSKVGAAILQVAELMPPPIPEWVDATEIKVPATADCPAVVMMSGFPNILQPGMVGGGLTDGRYRQNIADVTMDFDLSASLWGAEKVGQWYLNYALAGNADEHFSLKGMPYMRVKSQASQVISLGTLNTPATGIGYGFTTDELVDGKIYVHTGASRGLVRTISANNNDNSTGGTITYSGTALTLAEGNWFVVLPPATNFRLVGTILNNGSGNIVKFRRLGNIVQLLEQVSPAISSGGAIVEDISVACPLATEALMLVEGNTQEIGYPSASFSVGSRSGQSMSGGTNTTAISFILEFCRYWSKSGTPIYLCGYSYPAGRGY